jgi:Arc/MetJ-type ribon-helix-helix transcriptional regulator
MVIIMADNVHELRPKPADTEKITINLGYVDLGHVDLMVQEGFYSNRTDFIRTAIRNQLERHADVVKQSTARKSLDLGLRNYSREDLEAARRAGEMLRINVLGLAVSPKTSRPSLLAPQLPQSPCWELCMPVRRSRPLSPTGRGEGYAETGHSS